MRPRCGLSSLTIKPTQNCDWTYFKQFNGITILIATFLLTAGRAKHTSKVGGRHVNLLLLRISISWSKSVSVSWFLMRSNCMTLAFQTWQKWFRILINLHTDKKCWILFGIFWFSPNTLPGFTWFAESCCKNLGFTYFLKKCPRTGHHGSKIHGTRWWALITTYNKLQKPWCCWSSFIRRKT